MNADITPMNADNSMNIESRSVEDVESSPASLGDYRNDQKLSAFIGVISAFIGVSKTLANHGHHVSPHAT